MLRTSSIRHDDHVRADPAAGRLRATWWLHREATRLGLRTITVDDTTTEDELAGRVTHAFGL